MAGVRVQVRAVVRVVRPLDRTNYSVQRAIPSPLLTAPDYAKMEAKLGALWRVFSLLLNAHNFIGHVISHASLDSDDVSNLSLRNSTIDWIPR